MADTIKYICIYPEHTWIKVALLLSRSTCCVPRRYTFQQAPCSLSSIMLVTTASPATDGYLKSIGTVKALDYKPPELLERTK